MILKPCSQTDFKSVYGKEKGFSGRMPVDRTGIRYGKLIALEATEKRQGGSVVWRCRCDCGNVVLVSAKNLASGKVSSCGCLRRKMMAERAPDLRGRRFGKLTALEPVEERRGGGVVWRCRCDCGIELLVRSSHLASGEKKSCKECRESERKNSAAQKRKTEFAEKSPEMPAISEICIEAN